MTDNPFEDPPKAQPAIPVAASASPYLPPSPGSQRMPPIAPGALTTILIFCLILGILGWFGNCLGGGSLLMMSAMEGFIESIDEIPEEQKVFTRLQMTSAKSVMLVGIIQVLLNVVVATMLIIGSIGCLRRKESSRGFLRLSLLAAILYSLFKVGTAVYSYFATTSSINESVEKLAGDPLYDSVKQQIAANQPMAIGSMAVGVLISLALLGFYFWARSYLGKQEVENYFTDSQKYLNEQRTMMGR